MRRSVLVAAGFVVSAAVFFAPSAAAAPPPDCKKVERAQAKKRASRVKTLLAVAKCHHAAGQYTAAWYEYAEAAARARDAKDKASLKIAQKGERENAGLLAWITVKADADSTIEVDGEKTVSGAKKAVDPGKHTVTASGPHRQPAWTKTLELQSGDVEEIDVPAAAVEPAAATEPAPAAPAPAPPAPAPIATVTAPAAPPPKDKPAASAPEPVENANDHTGFVADLDTLVELYKEPPPDAQNREGGQAFVFVPVVAYDFTTSLRAFAKWGLVDNYAPGRAHATALANAALGARYKVHLLPWVDVFTEAGLVLPLGTSGGDDPNVGNPIRVANLRARALNPTLFDPNYITPYVGGGAALRYQDVDVRFDVSFNPSFKTGGLDQDKSKSRLIVGAHTGYWIIPQLEPFLELRWFRFLSSNAGIDADPSLADNLFGGIGIGGHIAPFRAQLVYLRALDAPLTRDDFAVLTIRLGVDF